MSNRTGRATGIAVARRGRPATGSVLWADEAKTIPLGVRVTCADGRRHRIRFASETTREDALALGHAIAQRERLADNRRETVRAYAERWCAWRAARGLGSASADRKMLERHILPQLGALEVCAVTRDDLKRLVLSLDAKTRQGFAVGPGGISKPFGWKTALNAWSVVRALFRDAQRAKALDLCVRADNPSDGIAGPDRGPTKAKPYLWPTEFLALVTCRCVPVRWRRLFAIAVCTYLRPGELAALDCDDADLEHRVLHVHRAVDRVRRGRLKATKTGRARRIPIEPTVVPLLQALFIEARGQGPVFPMPSVGVLSAKLKKYLRVAGITRADLFTSDATRRAITFYDLRATGITWMAIRGDDPLKIMQRAGHERFDTTRRYIREAENLAAGFGRVFPPLPTDLLDTPKSARGISAIVSAFGLPREDKLKQFRALFVELTGIEPAQGQESARNVPQRARKRVPKAT
jgi:integrase